MFAGLVLVISLIGYRATAAEPEGATSISPSIEQVVKLHDSGVVADVLLAYVRETPMAKPNADEVLFLTERGIPKEIIVTMLSKRIWAESPPTQSQRAPTQGHTQLPPAVAPTQAATQTVIYLQPPAPSVTYVSPPPVYYNPWYYDPWPRVSLGIGFGFGHHGHHWRGHHRHGIGIHRR